QVAAAADLRCVRVRGGRHPQPGPVHHAGAGAAHDPAVRDRRAVRVPARPPPGPRRRVRRPVRRRGVPPEPGRDRRRTGEGRPHRLTRPDPRPDAVPEAAVLGPDDGRARGPAAPSLRPPSTGVPAPTPATEPPPTPRPRPRPLPRTPRART